MSVETGYAPPEAVVEKKAVAGAELPIVKYREEIEEAIRENPTALISGETGSGKTTQLPGFLLESLPADSRIIITEPRRIAARSTAGYVAKQQDTKLGDEVGYWVRFDEKTNDGTKLTFATDGVLLSQVRSDPLLLDYDAVVVDEAHERSVNIDLLLGLLKKAQAKRAEMGQPLKIVVTSATLEQEKFAKYFDDAPSVEVPGRTFPIETHYVDVPPPSYYRDGSMRINLPDVIGAAAGTVQEILSSTKVESKTEKEVDDNNREKKKEASQGEDILIFMPGEKEIQDTIRQISGSVNSDEVEILPLYASLGAEAQDNIFKPSGKRKIIVATNIAETSVTIPTVKHVIDSGLIKQKQYDQRTGLEGTSLIYHSQAGLEQRRGRAGRTQPGVCYRLFSEEMVQRLPEHQKPEIQRSDLAHVVLTMKKLDFSNEEILNFDFIDQPDKQTLLNALSTLTNLGAIDENQKLTAKGETMSMLPLTPQLGNMLIEAKNSGCVSEVSTLAALMSARSVFRRPSNESEVVKAKKAHAKYRSDKNSDFTGMIELWRDYNQVDYKNRRQWAFDNYLDFNTLDETVKVRNQILSLLRSAGFQATSNQDSEAIGKAVTAGLLENLCVLKGSEYYRLSDDRRVIINNDSSVVKDSKTLPEFVVYGSANLGGKNIYLDNIQGAKSEWIIDLVPPNEITKNFDLKDFNSDVQFDSEHDRLTQTFASRYRGVDLKEERGVDEDHEAQVMMRAIETKLKSREADNFLPELDFSWYKDVSDYNQKIIKQYEDLRGRDRSLPMLDFKAEVVKKLDASQIKGPNELNEKIKNGEIDLRLSLDDYIDAKRREQISTNYPDQITVDDYTYMLTYSNYTDGVNAKMPVADYLRLQRAPIFPGNKQLDIDIVFPNGSSRNARLWDLQNEQQAIVKEENKSFLTQWLKNNRVVYDADYYKQHEELPKLSEQQTIVNPLTGNEMVVYPGYELQTLDRPPYGFASAYFTNEEDARINTFAAEQYATMRKGVMDEKNDVEKLDEELDEIKGQLEQDPLYKRESYLQYLTDDETASLAATKEYSSVQNSYLERFRIIKYYFDIAKERYEEKNKIAEKNRELLDLAVKETLSDLRANLENSIDPPYDHWVGDLNYKGTELGNFYYDEEKGEIYFSEKYEFDKPIYEPITENQIEIRISFKDRSTETYFFGGVENNDTEETTSEIEANTGFIDYDPNTQAEIRDDVNAYLGEYSKKVKNNARDYNKLYGDEEVAVELANYTTDYDNEGEVIFAYYLVGKSGDYKVEVKVNKNWKNLIGDDMFLNEFEALKPNKLLNKKR